MTQAAVALDPLTQGWFNHGSKILELVERHRPKVCVELGTWQGASAIPVARAIRRWGGTLTCVDTWGGDLNGGLGSLQSPWMLLSCVRNMTQAEVSGVIRLISCTTLEAARAWTEPIDSLYVDADHSYEGVRADLRAWVPFVKPGGLILGDDYGSDLYPGVKAAWDEFEHERGLTLARYQSTPPDPHGIQLIYGTV
ncbi:MAG TPA: class I SAM-dependent methyltransferase [Vicinamibacterales bacterium]|nr:class I SAM-dependent methyltransferase [Vicinamibacterales bacterium]